MKKTTNRKPSTDQPLIEQLLYPFQEFVKTEASGGLVLIAATVAALLLANSAAADFYHRIWDTPLILGAGHFVLEKPLLLWINDGLMAVFFFVVGLEIKREILVGELRSPRQAILPIAAAFGGMIVPAFIYRCVVSDGPGANGWGIPMATDIAFALGILSMLGSRAPLSLKVFLTALAIVDDLGAVLVIAIFYSHSISWSCLAAGGAILLLLLAMNRAGVRSPGAYAIWGVLLWLAFLKSGIHATIAGALFALTIPARTRIDASSFSRRCANYLRRFDAAGQADIHALSNEDQQAALAAMERAIHQAEAPLQRLEHHLHPWVTYAIMPVFALANAGVSFGAGVATTLVDPISLGIMAGLIVGKQVGIMGPVWLLIRCNAASLPAGASWQQLYGVSWLAGVGFTMSLFVSGLAFGDSATLDVAKIGILFSSVVAGAVGFTILRLSTPQQSDDAANGHHTT